LEFGVGAGEPDEGFESEFFGLDGSFENRGWYVAFEDGWFGFVDCLCGFGLARFAGFFEWESRQRVDGGLEVGSFNGDGVAELLVGFGEEEFGFEFVGFGCESCVCIEAPLFF